MINRILEDRVLKRMSGGKAVILIGARQVGKTTLLRNIISRKKHLFLDCDDSSVVSMLTNPNTQELKDIIGKNKIVFIDEAQRVPNIGLTLKIITDQFKTVQLLVSGSSSFELTRELNEPLTGRKWEYEMYPVSWSEYEDSVGLLKASQTLHHRLIYGLYPDVINNPTDEKEILKNMVSSYLYKDILSLSGIRKPEILDRLVQALALQVGSQVNFNELSKLLSIDKNTIINYVDVLEKAYVIFKLPCFSKNVRNELKTSKKIYFHDNGVINAVLGNFSNIELRKDKGALWENFLISERLKFNKYYRPGTKMYFWRTRQQQEIDLVEDYETNLYAYEFKWKRRNKMKIPKTFSNAYHADEKLIDISNYREFLKYTP
jgi:predicted AAA+ superfamily ATPase